MSCFDTMNVVPRAVGQSILDRKGPRGDLRNRSESPISLPHLRLFRLSPLSLSLSLSPRPKTHRLVRVRARANCVSRCLRRAVECALRCCCGAPERRVFLRSLVELQRVDVDEKEEKKQVSWAVLRRKERIFPVLLSLLLPELAPADFTEKSGDQYRHLHRRVMVSGRSVPGEQEVSGRWAQGSIDQSNTRDCSRGNPLVSPLPGVQRRLVPVQGHLCSHDHFCLRFRMISRILCIGFSVYLMLRRLREGGRR
ncbi:hypothetical protein LZ30DRAFT_70967 [Colletotrichum cereale]|nr:hypothetical protein LZ30DRAFT_70967 [Colletotrichum cereale]